MHPILLLLQNKGLNPTGRLPDSLVVNDVTEVSGECRKGSLFVAIKGFKADGHIYIPDAAARGAVAALVTEEILDPPEGMHVIAVDDTRRAAGPVAQLVAGEPTRHMDVAGVTGTNGKTTTTFLMEAIFKAAGRNPGIMGTVVTRWGDKQFEAKETTPSGPSIARLLRRMKGDGCDCAAFEVSSHAIDQHRVDGIRFRAMGLTNITQDHLDYHKTMEAYAAVKMSIFEKMLEEDSAAVGVVNVDDAWGRKLYDKLPAENRIGFSIEGAKAELVAENIAMTDAGLEISVDYRGQKIELKSPMHGKFNAQNALTATGLALSMGISVEAIQKGVAGFSGAPGRFEVVDGLPGVKVIVDYAHTPDAVIKLLQNARGLAKGRLIAVFGCGGDRDKTKRPIMGKAALELADEAIVTSDNPRTEDPAKIIEDILAGMNERPEKAKRVIQDRREAIVEAVGSAQPGDVVVIAGKGHEDYQIVGTVKHHFDDREEARKAIAGLAK